MAGKRKSHSVSFKSKVAIAASREQETVSQLSSRYAVHSSQIQQWKRLVLEGAEGLFGTVGRPKKGESDEVSVAELYEQIGRQARSARYKHDAQASEFSGTLAHSLARRACMGTIVHLPLA